MSSGALLPLGGHVHGVREDLGGGLRPDLGGDGELGIVVPDHLVGPVEDLGAVVLGYADQLGDGLQGQLRGDGRDEVEGAVLGAGALDDRRGPVAQPLLQRPDGPGREPALHDLPYAGVLGRIHVQQDEPLSVDRIPFDVLVEPDDRGVEVGGEDLGVGGHVLHIRVAGHRPVPLVLEAGDIARLRDPADRFGTAQLGELR